MVVGILLGKGECCCLARADVGAVDIGEVEAFKLLRSLAEVEVVNVLTQTVGIGSLSVCD